MWSLHPFSADGDTDRKGNSSDGIPIHLSLANLIFVCFAIAGVTNSHGVTFRLIDWPDLDILNGVNIDYEADEIEK